MTRRTWLVLGALGLSATGAAWGRRRFAAPAAPTQSVAAPDLVVDAGDLDFGTVWEADRLVRAVTVRNRSAAPRVVTAVAGSCTCQSFAPVAFTLPPGGEQVVRVTLDLHSQLARSADPKPTEEFAASLWATVAGDDRTAYWRMTGKVRRTLQAPERIDLGAVSDRTPTAAAATLPVRSLAGRLESLSAAAGPWVRAAVLPGPRPDLFHLTVTPLPGLVRRAHATSVTLSPVLASGEALPAVSIPVAFEVGAEVQVVPAVVQLGGRTVGSEARDTVALRAVGGRPFRVVGVRTSDSGLTARPLEQDGVTAYELTRTVAAPGPFDDRLTFEVEADGEAFEVVVPVRGFGYAAA